MHLSVLGVQIVKIPMIEQIILHEVMSWGRCTSTKRTFTELVGKNSLECSFSVEVFFMFLDQSLGLPGL